MIYDTKDKKLISGAAQFFEAKLQLQEIFASEDGQYFHSVSASNYHCKQRGLKLFRITRAQAIQPAKVEPEKPAETAKAEPAEPAKAEPAKPEINTEAKRVPPPKKKAGRPAAKTDGNAKTTK